MADSTYGLAGLLIKVTHSFAKLVIGKTKTRNLEKHEKWQLALTRPRPEERIPYQERRSLLSTFTPMMLGVIRCRMQRLVTRIFRSSAP